MIDDMYLGQRLSDRHRQLQRIRVEIDLCVGYYGVGVPAVRVAPRLQVDILLRVAFAVALELSRHVPAGTAAGPSFTSANAPEEGITAATPAAVERRSSSRRFNAGPFERDDLDIQSPFGASRSFAVIIRRAKVRKRHPSPLLPDGDLPFDCGQVASDAVAYNETGVASTPGSGRTLASIGPTDNHKLLAENPLSATYNQPGQPFLRPTQMRSLA